MYYYTAILQVNVGGVKIPYHYKMRCSTYACLIGEFKVVLFCLATTAVIIYLYPIAETVNVDNR